MAPQGQAAASAAGGMRVGGQLHRALDGLRAISLTSLTRLETDPLSLLSAASCITNSNILSQIS
eukprot:4113474-Lingulodinium_polyedra.AAC.1